MELLLSFIIGTCLILGYFPEKSPPVDQFSVTIDSGKHLKARHSVTPAYITKYRNVVRQTYDYSCGSAALATLLRYQFEEHLTEKEVIHGLLKFGDKDQIAKMRAFSLLDMKKYLNALGYSGAGYIASLEDLKNPSHWPCIVPIKLYNYRHFVVLKGIYDGRIFFADPFSGNTSYALSNFKNMWHQNIVFIVSSDENYKISALKIKNEDLKYINEASAKHVVLSRIKPFNIPGEIRMINIPGKRQVVNF